MAVLIQLMALVGVACAMIGLNAALFGFAAKPVTASDLDAAAARPELCVGEGARFFDEGGRAAILIGERETLAVAGLGDRHVARRLPNDAMHMRVSRAGVVITFAGMARARLRLTPAAPVEALVRRLGEDRPLGGAS